MSMPRLAQKPGKPGDDAGLVEADHVDGIWQQLGARRARLGALHVQRQAGGFAEARELAFELGEGMPVAADQHQHGEFVAEARHAALADGSAAVRDYAGQVVDHPGAIAANGGYGEVLLHLAASVPQPFGLRMAGVRPYHARPFYNDPRIYCMYAGSLVALVTPMQPDGSIDFDAWSRLLEFHVANGTTGIVVAGSTGESATVTDAELRELLVHARRTLGKRALAHRQRRHQQHRHLGRARALDFRARRRCVAGRVACLCAADAARVCSCISKRSPRTRAFRCCSTTCRAAPRSTCCRPPWRACRACRASSASRKRWAMPRACASSSRRAPRTSRC